MKGYHKNEEATKDSITEEGYFKTGDLGYYDPEKGLFITERIKELIKVRNFDNRPTSNATTVVYNTKNSNYNSDYLTVL